MPFGQKCPSCFQQTLHKSEEGRRCSNCGFMGWALQDQFSPGPGMGRRCPWCGKRTLHTVGGPLREGELLHAVRCSVCNFAGVGSF